MKLKGIRFADVAEIQEAVTDELKKVQKRGNFDSFSIELILNEKSYASSSFVSYFLNKSVLERLDRTLHVVVFENLVSVFF